MKHIFFALLLTVSGFSQTSDFLNTKINVASGSTAVKSNYTIENWSKNSKLVSISFTNNGKQTEFIKDIYIQFNATPKFGEKSSAQLLKTIHRYFDLLTAGA